MWFVSEKSTFASLWMFVAFLRLGCGQDISNGYQRNGVRTPTPGSPSSASDRFLRGSATSSKISCSAPPQLKNGGWRLRPEYCGRDFADCKVPEGTELGTGYQLIYDCATGYKIEGNDVVRCGTNGEWTSVPTCKEVRCGPLIDAAYVAHCRYSNHNESCDRPTLPNTLARVRCRSGYKTDLRFSSPKSDVLRCDEDGNWKGSPVRCIPVCGVESPRDISLIASANGWDAEVRDFPWHATLYTENRSARGTRKVFICGGTIIQTNVVMTAAHCVYDEVTRTVQDAANLFVITGNYLRDYDHPMHDSKFVKKATVKRVNLPFDYYGLRGNYGSDIALLELKEPFVFSPYLLPACWAASGPGAPVLDDGAIGKLVGFGRTTTKESSPILQEITAPYVSYGKCRVPQDTADNFVFITKDKFCAGYLNGSVVCDGDSGGGIVFRFGNEWHVMGIVSVGLGVDLNNGERTCASHALTLYTKVSEYVDWIEKVISDAKSSEPNLLASVDRNSPPPSSSAPRATVSLSRSPITRFTGCVSPKQPINGRWELHPTQCVDLAGIGNCDVASGVALEAGTTLVYRCNPGYKVTENCDVHCTRLGKWSSSPECVSESLTPNE